MDKTEAIRLREIGHALGAALPIVILFVAVLSVPLSIAPKLALSEGEVASWILSAWGMPGLLTLLFVVFSRQPIVLTGNVFALILVGSLSDRLSYSEAVAAFLCAGLAVVVVATFDITRFIARWIPAPVVLGLLAGAIVPFVADTFTMIGSSPWLIAVPVVAYLMGRRFARRVPAVLPALAAGLLTAWILGEFRQPPEILGFSRPSFTMPVFSLEAVVTVAPVLVVLVVLQSNVPSIVYMKTQGLATPARVIDLVGGTSTIVGSLFGPTTVALSLPVTSLVANKRLGSVNTGAVAAAIAGASLVLIGFLGRAAAELPAFVPMPLLLTLAGLAMIDVFVGTMRSLIRSPLLLGPLLAFAVVLSDMTLFGLGRFFWFKNHFWKWE